MSHLMKDDTKPFLLASRAFNFCTERSGYSLVCRLLLKRKEGPVNRLE